MQSDIFAESRFGRRTMAFRRVLGGGGRVMGKEAGVGVVGGAPVTRLQ